MRRTPAPGMVGKPGGCTRLRTTRLPAHRYGFPYQNSKCPVKSELAMCWATLDSHSAARGRNQVVFIRTPVKRYSIAYCDSYGKPTPLPRTGLTSADSEKI